jgi:hypothetical protein
MNEWDFWVCTVCEPNPCWVGDLTMHQLHMPLFWCFPEGGRIALTHNEFFQQVSEKKLPHTHRWYHPHIMIIHSYYYTCSTSKHIFCHHPSYARVSLFLSHNLFQVQFLINWVSSTVLFFSPNLSFLYLFYAKHQRWHHSHRTCNYLVELMSLFITHLCSLLHTICCDHNSLMESHSKWMCNTSGLNSLNWLKWMTSK